MVRHGEIGIDENASGTIAFRAEPFARGRSLNARRPNHGTRVDPLPARFDEVRIHRRHGRIEAYLDAQFFKAAFGFLGQVGRQTRKNARARFDENDARRARIDVAEILRQREPHEFGNRARHFHAGRSAADDNDIHEAPTFRGIGLVLGVLEGEEDAPADFGGVFDQLQSGRELLPIVVPEIGVARAGRQHEIIVWHIVSGFRQNFPRLGVDSCHMIEHHGDVAICADNAADGFGDFGRREFRRRHLVKQRLEQVIVLTVDQHDIDWRTAQRLHRPQPAKSCAYDDDFRPGLLHRMSCIGSADVSLQQKRPSSNSRHFEPRF